MDIDIEQVTFDQFLANPDLYQRWLKGDYWRMRGEWIKSEMERLGFVWVTVCGGMVVAGSNGLFEFPSEEEIERIGRMHKKIPFTFSADMPVEEVVFMTELD